MLPKRPCSCLLPLLVLACAAPQPTDGLPGEDPGGSFPVLTGNFLGQTPPGAEPEVFAPGIVSTGLFTRDLAMTPDGDEIYFSVTVGAAYDFSAIMTTRRIDGRWTEPETLPFAASQRFMDLELCVSPDGRKFFFVSNRPRDGGSEPGDHDIWVADRAGDGWGAPVRLGPPVNTEAPEFFPSVTGDGTLYFTRENPDRSNAIWRSRWLDGVYAEPERLPEQVNAGRDRFNAFIAADESFLILPIFGRDDSLGATDYYVAFRSPEDDWSEPVHLGDKVNSKSRYEYSASLSPDGRYLFFMSSRPRQDSLGEHFTAAALRRLVDEPRNGNPNVYWIDGSWIAGLRPEGF